MRFSREATARTARALFESALGQLYVDTNHDYRNSIFLAGFARGGSTWVAELINFDNSYRLIFEPLRVPQCRPFHFGRYLRPSDDNPTCLERMELVVSGRLRHVWSDRYNRQPLPHKRLIKEISANLILGWLRSHFPEMPLILLLRHPCAILKSRRRLGLKMSGIAGYLKQPQLVADYLVPYQADMERASPLEAFFFRWCVDTLIPLRQLKKSELHVAFFEDFCIQPQRELSRLFSFLGKHVDQRVFTVLDRPSSQAWRSGEKLPSRLTLAQNWQDGLSGVELRTAQHAMRLFGLDSLYRDDGTPDLASALRLFAQ
jgi:hypothetical protein